VNKQINLHYLAVTKLKRVLLIAAIGLLLYPVFLIVKEKNSIVEPRKEITAYKNYAIAGGRGDTIFSMRIRAVRELL